MLSVDTTSPGRYRDEFMRRRLPWLAAASLACTPPFASDGEATSTGDGDGIDTSVLTDTGDGDDTDTSVPTDTGAADTAALSNTAADTDTGEAAIPCPPIDPHIKYELDADGVYDTVVTTQGELAILAGCTDIAGSLQITGDITDLTPLASLRRIVGSLYIDGIGMAPELLSLAGLEGLESVRSVELDNLQITSLEPFAGLTTLPGALKLHHLTQLESLAGLHNLTHVGGPLRITEAYQLGDLKPLAGLTDLPDELMIADLPALTSLEGLHHIVHLGGRLSIDNCSQLADLDGLRGLQRVDDRLFLGQLPITTLHGLEALTEVGGPGGEPVQISLYLLSELTSLDALAIEWHEAHAIWIYRSHITNLGTFSGVPELGGLALTEVDDLVDLTGLESLTVVHEALDLRENASLGDIGALANLQSFGALNLERSILTDLPLPGLTQVNAVRASDNAELIALSGLAGFTAIGSLVLEDNPKLVALPDLSALEEVVGDFEIRRNDALTTVDDLAAVTTVGGNLRVVSNAELLQTEAVTWGESFAVGKTRKIVRNKGDVDPPADPCPWFEDGECDEEGGTGACAPGTDGWDCVIGD